MYTVVLQLGGMMLAAQCSSLLMNKLVKRACRAHRLMDYRAAKNAAEEASTKFGSGGQSVVPVVVVWQWASSQRTRNHCCYCCCRDATGIDRASDNGSAGRKRSSIPSSCANAQMPLLLLLLLTWPAIFQRRILRLVANR